jgi:hypothetical protein
VTVPESLVTRRLLLRRRRDDDRAPFAALDADPVADFGHPRVPEDHALHEHLLDRLPAARWRGQTGGAS